MFTLKLVPEGTCIEFIKWHKIAYVLSAVVAVASLVLFFVRDLNYGIDFEGGVMIEVGFEQPVNIDELRGHLGSLGLGDVAIQEFGDPRDMLIRVEQQPGDVVQPGIPIVSILVDGPSRIEGFLPESNLSSIAVGTPANIYPTVSMRDVGVITGSVTQISPAVYSLPGRASPIRGQVVRGRRVTFELDEQVELVPGETVSIEIESSLFEPVSLED